VVEPVEWPSPRASSSERPDGMMPVAYRGNGGCTGRSTSEGTQTSGPPPCLTSILGKCTRRSRCCRSWPLRYGMRVPRCSPHRGCPAQASAPAVFLPRRRPTPPSTRELTHAAFRAAGQCAIPRHCCCRRTSLLQAEGGPATNYGQPISQRHWRCSRWSKALLPASYGDAPSGRRRYYNLPAPLLQPAVGAATTRRRRCSQRLAGLLKMAAGEAPSGRRRCYNRVAVMLPATGDAATTGRRRRDDAPSGWRRCYKQPAVLLQTRGGAATTGSDAAPSRRRRHRRCCK
jgi:hypothetical protein